mgnify:FL=1
MEIQHAVMRSSSTVSHLSLLLPGGYLSIDNFYYSGDVMPPGKITDLSLVAALRDQNTFRLSWSSPGDDFFQGTGQSFLCSVHDLFIFLNIFWSA